MPLRAKLKFIEEQIEMLEDLFKSYVKSGAATDEYADLMIEQLRVLENIMLGITSPTPGDPGYIERLAQLARAYQRSGTPVTIITTAGSVSGRIDEVGEDYVLIAEPEGTQVLVNLANTLAIYPQGLE